MEISPQMQGSHAVASPCGKYVASLSNSKLQICSTTSPERSTSINIRPVKDTTALKWNAHSTRIAVTSAQSTEVLDVEDAGHRVRVENGSGSLGRLTCADFIDSDQLLVIWEFGKTKLWNLSNGKSLELADIKTTCNGSAWQVRPYSNSGATQTLAILSRNGADDVLNVYIPSTQKHLASHKLPTIDAQALSWSPDGRWLTVLDTPTANSSIHIFTPDGHRFRSYPALGDNTSPSLGVKSCVWSQNSQILALTRYDGRLVLLNTRTFAPLALIEHTTTIDQRALSQERQAPIWQENVSASGERSYVAATQPVSPPLSKTKPSTEPSELGVAEACFSCDGSFLATRDERMLNSVWIWNMSTLAAYVVLIQHNNVRRLHWHPTRPELLMLDCAEGIAYAFDVMASNSPVPLHTSMPGTANLSWLHTATTSRPAILSATKSSFRLVYPEGIPTASEESQGYARPGTPSNDLFDEGASEDSLYDVLSGKKPMPPKTEQSYTERLDLEVETEEEDMTTRVDDTFREMKSRKGQSFDPLDDSEIF